MPVSLSIKNVPDEIVVKLKGRAAKNQTNRLLFLNSFYVLPSSGACCDWNSDAFKPVRYGVGLLQYWPLSASFLDCGPLCASYPTTSRRVRTKDNSKGVPRPVWQLCFTNARNVCIR